MYGIKWKGVKVIKVLLIDDDSEFRKRFSNYIAVNCDAIMLTVTGSSAAEKQDVKRMIQASELVLIDEKTEGFDELISEQPDKCVVLTGKKPEGRGGVNEITAFAEDEAFYKADGSDADGKRNGKKNGLNCIHVYKFQSAPDILRSIPQLALYADISVSHKFSSAGMSITAVSGFSGGCGKTGLALTLARFNQQRMKKNTLIVSLAQVSDINDYFPYAHKYKSGYDFLYGRGKDDGNLKQDINMLLLNFVSGASVNPGRFLIRDSSGVSTFILPSELKNDIVDLDGVHIKRFIEYIEDWQLFDTVIFDMDNGLSDRNMAVYDMSDKIFLLSNAGRYRKNSEMLWEEIILRHCENSGIVRVTNFCGESENSESISAEDVCYMEREADFMLPWDRESFFIKDGVSDISMVGKYAAAVSYLFDEAMII